MRQTAGALNRGWLAVLGILLILAALVAGLIALGQLTALAAMVGLGFTAPAPESELTSGMSMSWLGQPITAAIAVVAGLLLGLLALLWLVAQVPRRNKARSMRLHDDPSQGFTTCAPEVITRAVEDQIESLPGVSKATALLRGTAAEPDLTVRVTANDRSDLPELLQSLQDRIARDLTEVLETPLERFAVELDVNTERRSSRTVSLGQTARVQDAG